jgi:hypothetical protein
MNTTGFKLISQPSDSEKAGTIYKHSPLQSTSHTTDQGQYHDKALNTFQFLLIDLQQTEQNNKAFQFSLLHPACQDD